MMKIEEFKEKLNGTKSGKETALLDIQVKTNPQRTEKTIYSFQRCSSCKTEKIHEVKVSFFRPVKSLTIFQAGMLYSIYCLSKKPRDYAQYHKCIAGKEFIENIREIG